MISKESFVDAIDGIKKADDYQKKFNSFFRTIGCKGYMIQPDCAITVVNLLHEIFGEADADGLISHFCFELDFGDKCNKSKATDKNGNQVKLSKAEELYEFLIDN